MLHVESIDVYVVANNKISFFFMAEKYSIVCVYHMIFVLSSVDGYLVASVIGQSSVILQRTEWGAYIFSNQCFYFLQKKKKSQEGNCWIIWEFCFSFLRNVRILFGKSWDIYK